MNVFFERLPFDGKPYIWNHNRTSDLDFKGYYHWHEGCEILIVHRGEGRVIVNQQTYDIQPGKLFFFQPFQLHKVHVEVNSERPYDRSIFHFDPVALELCLTAFPSLHLFFTRLRHGMIQEQAFSFIEEIAYVYEICKAFDRDEKKHSPYHAEEQGTLLLLQLLNCIRSTIKSKNNQVSLSASSLYRYSEQIMQWMEENYADSFDLQRLADELHLSRTYVSRVFRQETGSSLMDYLSARRIKQACNLLRTTDMSVDRIAEEIGLSNTSYFIRLFKKVIGTTPYQYKRANM